MLTKLASPNFTSALVGPNVPVVGFAPPHSLHAGTAGTGRDGVAANVEKMGDCARMAVPQEDAWRRCLATGANSLERRGGAFVVPFAHSSSTGGWRE